MADRTHLAVSAAHGRAAAEWRGMNPEQWSRVKGLFQQALERPVEERTAWVRSCCDGDRALEHEVESLLVAHQRAGSFANRPELELMAGMSADVQTAVGGPALRPGDRLGLYEIRDLVGAGGMGEVYRAHDVRLRRDVAIKVLPTAFTSDRERVARFNREARLLAALNHPNIAAIYGIE